MSSSRTWSHLLAEAAEMRRHEEVAMDAGRRADRAGGDEAPDPPRLGQIAPVLDHRMDPPGVPRRRDDGPRVLQARRQRLLGQDVAAVPQRRLDDPAARRRHRDVEDDVRLGQAQHRVEVAADHRVVEAELPARCPGMLGIDVDEPDDLGARAPRRFEPGPAHRATADQNRANHRLPPTARRPLSSRTVWRTSRRDGGGIATVRQSPPFTRSRRRAEASAGTGFRRSHSRSSLLRSVDRSSASVLTALASTVRS